MWTQEKIDEIVKTQREFFQTGTTLDVTYRIKQLKKLKDAMIRYQKDIEQALYDDLKRNEVESYLCDIGSVILEINETINGVRKWARKKSYYSGLICFPSTRTTVHMAPYGVSLIISPFNFPILLTFGVLVASIGAGNTAILKCSSKSAACTAVMKKIVDEIYDPNYVCVIDGGHDVADFCLNARVDKIFYTGSPKVAKHVMEKAACNLTPVALELGGENGNWAIVRKDADLKDAARKIAFFKAVNSGQVCININQVAVAEEIADKFIELLKEEFTRQLGENIERNEEYSALISKSAYEWCAQEADQYKDRIVFGGTGDPNTFRFSPTIIYPVNIKEPIVQHELFNPLLPIVPFKDDDVNSVLKEIESREHPLAFYVFTKDMKWARKTMDSMQFGGGCINEVCIHMMVKGVPFNGTGHSGMGAYHGVWGFNEFSHPVTILEGKRHFNLPLREHPYSGSKNEYKLKYIKKFEK